MDVYPPVKAVCVRTAVPEWALPGSTETVLHQSLRQTRDGSRSLQGLRTRIASRFLALAPAISLNHRLGRPPRALINYTV